MNVVVRTKPASVINGATRGFSTERDEAFYTIVANEPEVIPDALDTFQVEASKSLKFTDPLEAHAVRIANQPSLAAERERRLGTERERINITEAIEENPRLSEAFRTATAPRKRGRPRESDALIFRIKELRAAGESWVSLTRVLNAETGTYRVDSAYRQLLRGK